ncbi:MAG: DUF202 domain-containing protein [Cyclobacteriaceae bacterium]
MKIKKKLTFPKMVAEFENKEKIILRDYLALERTTMANIRTLYAIIRTSIYLVLAGIAFISLETFKNLSWVGYVLFGISVIILILGFLRFIELKGKLKKFYKFEENEKSE